MDCSICGSLDRNVDRVIEMELTIYIGVFKTEKKSCNGKKKLSVTGFFCCHASGECFRGHVLSVIYTKRVRSVRNGIKPGVLFG